MGRHGQTIGIDLRGEQYQRLSSDVCLVSLCVLSVPTVRPNHTFGLTSILLVEKRAANARNEHIKKNRRHGN